MKTVIPIALFCALLTSCSGRPEPYEKALTQIQEKNYDEAIASLNLVNKEDKEWFDSAKAKKSEAFKLLLETENWKKIFRVMAKNEDDDDFLFAASDNIESYYLSRISKGRAYEALTSLAANKEKFTEYLDTLFFRKIITACEDSLFTGLWKGKGEFRDNEIYFKRDGSDLSAYSNNTSYGWPKDGIMYKGMNYISGTTWKMSPRIFKSYDWEDYSYFSKKGKLHMLGKDSIQIDYEVLGSENLFIRK